MSRSGRAEKTSATLDATDVMQVSSNKISDVLAELSQTALADAKHLRLTSTPGDDLAEEDFEDRVRTLLQPMTGLASLTICIPSMARLHPSNSLPKVLDVLRDASTLRPDCLLGLVVHEAEQAWSALPILNGIIDMRLSLHMIEFSRAYFPVKAIIQTSQTCNLASLIVRNSQISVSSSALEAAASTPAGDSGKETPSIPTLTSLTADADFEASPGLGLLLQTAASTLTHLDLSSDGSDSSVWPLVHELPRLERFTLHEDLLSEITRASMPVLQDIILPTLTRTTNCEAIQNMLQSSSFPRLRNLRVSRIEAGNVSDALVRLGETHHASIAVSIGELAVRDPADLTPAALASSEHLVNAGPPINGNWPLGFGDRSYPRLKSVMLKVHQGGNREEFIASIDAPNLDSAPKISLIGRRRGR